jgi:hypothetical protein
MKTKIEGCHSLIINIGMSGRKIKLESSIDQCLDLFVLAAISAEKYQVLNEKKIPNQTFENLIANPAADKGLYRPYVIQAYSIPALKEMITSTKYTNYMVSVVTVNSHIINKDPLNRESGMTSKLLQGGVNPLENTKLVAFLNYLRILAWYMAALCAEHKTRTTFTPEHVRAIMGIMQAGAMSNRNIVYELYEISNRFRETKRLSAKSKTLAQPFVPPTASAVSNGQEDPSDTTDMDDMTDAELEAFELEERLAKEEALGSLGSLGSSNNLAVDHLVGMSSTILTPLTIPNPVESSSITSTAQVISSATQVMPLTTQVMPLTTQVMPLTAQVMPLTAQVMPLTAQVVPLTTQVVPPTITSLEKSEVLEQFTGDM